MRKITVLIVLCSLVFFTKTFSQKYIKYIFQDNRIKFVLPVEFKEIKSFGEFQTKEIHPINRLWQTKDKKADFLIFMPLLKSKSNLETDAMTLIKDLSFYTENVTALADKSFKINNKQQAFLHTIISGDDMYSLISVYYEQNKLLLMSMRYNKKKQKKYDEIIKEIIKSLTIQ